MTTIYIVTEGEYSSYHIEAAFSTKELANKYMERMDGYKVWLEEYELDDTDTSWLNGDTHLWYVRFMPGSADVSQANRTAGKPEESINWYGNVDGRVYYLDVLADTQERAIKVASERRAIHIATGT